MDLTIANAHKLEAPAAQIAHNAIGLRECRDDTIARGRRFLIAAQQFDRQAETRNSRQKRGAVGRVAYRRGRNRPDVANVHGAQNRLKTFERAHRLGHGTRVKRPSLTGAPTQPRRHLFIEQYGRCPGRPVIDDETHRIRPDIDDRLWLVHVSV